MATGSRVGRLPGRFTAADPASVTLVRGWPPIDDPRVLEWLALDDAQWLAVLEQRVRGMGPRPCDSAAIEHALRYPWERPPGSYVLRDGRVDLLEELDPRDRRAVVSEFAGGRHPLVAFGANGAPERLEARFAAFDDPRDRDALVLTGHLHDLDVGAQASPTAFGSVPAVLVASPGTAVRASVLWLTPVQLAELTLAELGYRLGRLDGGRFTMDEADIAVDDLFAYISRVGALRLDDEPVVLAAVPATGRRFRALTQEQLLDVLAERLLGPAARGRDVIRACFEDMAGLLERVIPVTWPAAARLPDDRWTPYPVGVRPSSPHGERGRVDP